MPPLDEQIHTLVTFALELGRHTKAIRRTIFGASVSFL